MAGCEREFFGIFVFSWILFSCAIVSYGHPQCLDSRPPFRARTNLSFCRDYEEFGCCTPSDDLLLRNRYQRMMQLIPSTQLPMWNKCSTYAKTFLCQTCSPYAAHIFDAERSYLDNVVKPRAFPALCGAYCSEFFQSCKELVKYYMDEVGSDYLEENIRLSTAVSTGKNDFCAKVAVQDLDYCYPDLLTNSILNGNITIEKVTKEGCICVQPYSHLQFRNPIFLKHVKDGSDRLFVGEQIGLVHIMYINGSILPEPFLDITKYVETTTFKGDERGMLGMEFHPDYLTNGLLYIYYSTSLNQTEQTDNVADHKTRIEELRVDPMNPNVVDYGYSRVILEVYEPWWNHNGGEIMFGDDGYLYLFIGDGGKAGDPLESGQDLSSMLGKVHRIDVDNVDFVNSKEYSIPPDNPFPNTLNVRPEIYAYGVRNIWRCGKDRGDPFNNRKGKGRIVCGDVGQGKIEEVDLIEKGANYGWNLKEGTKDYCPNCHRANPEVKLTEPIAEYNHSVGKSVTGGHFYRGCESPNLNGFYIFGDFMSGKLFRLTEPASPIQKKWNFKELSMCGSDWCVPPLSNDYSTSIISFGEDEYGEVYMLSTSYASTSSPSGTVYKIVDPMRRGHPEDCHRIRNPTSPGTSPTTKGTSYKPVNTNPTNIGTGPLYTKEKPGTTSSTVKAGSTVNAAMPQNAGSSDPERMMNYLDYFKRQALRNRRRKMQKQFETEREEKKKNLSTYRGTPPPQNPPGLYFQGINIHRCTNEPNFWCSLNRLIPSP